MESVAEKLTGWRDNPTMSAARPIIPHSDFGDPNCCGCLFGIVRGDEADIRCNECEALLFTVLREIFNAR